jgi:hypothetical protein
MKPADRVVMLPTVVGKYRMRSLFQPPSLESGKVPIRQHRAIVRMEIRDCGLPVCAPPGDDRTVSRPADVRCRNGRGHGGCQAGHGDGLRSDGARRPRPRRGIRIRPMRRFPQAGAARIHRRRPRSSNAPTRALSFAAASSGNLRHFSG